MKQKGILVGTKKNEQVKCWVRVASSAWSVLWLRNTNRERLQKQVQKTTWKFVDNLIK